MLLLNFDFECAGVFGIPRNYYSHEFEKETLKNFRYIKENYPDVYDELKQKIQNIMNFDANSKNRIIESLITNDKDNKTKNEEIIFNRLLRNINHFNYYVEKLEREKQMI